MNINKLLMISVLFAGSQNNSFCFETYIEKMHRYAAHNDTSGLEKLIRRGARC